MRRTLREQLGTLYSLDFDRTSTVPEPSPESIARAQLAQERERERESNAAAYIDGHGKVKRPN